MAVNLRARQDEEVSATLQVSPKRGNEWFAPQDWKQLQSEINKIFANDRPGFCTDNMAKNLASKMADDKQAQKFINQLAELHVRIKNTPEDDSAIRSAFIAMTYFFCNPGFKPDPVELFGTTVVNLLSNPDSSFKIKSLICLAQLCEKITPNFKPEYFNLFQEGTLWLSERGMSSEYMHPLSNLISNSKFKPEYLEDFKTIVNWVNQKQEENCEPICSALSTMFSGPNIEPDKIGLFVASADMIITLFHSNLESKINKLKKESNGGTQVPASAKYKLTVDEKYDRFYVVISLGRLFSRPDFKKEDLDAFRSMVNWAMGLNDDATRGKALNLLSNIYKPDFKLDLNSFKNEVEK